MHATSVLIHQLIYFIMIITETRNWITKSHFSIQIIPNKNSTNKKLRMPVTPLARTYSENFKYLEEERKALLNSVEWNSFFSGCSGHHLSYPSSMHFYHGVHFYPHDSRWFSAAQVIYFTHHSLYFIMRVVAYCIFMNTVISNSTFSCALLDTPLKYHLGCLYARLVFLIYGPYLTFRRNYNNGHNLIKLYWIVLYMSFTVAIDPYIT